MSRGKILGKLNEWKEIEWKVPCLLTLSFDDTCVYESPSFTFVNTSWNLRIYPSTSFEMLLLCLHNESGGSYDATCSLSVKQSDGSLIATGTLDGIASGSVYVCYREWSPVSSPAEDMVIELALKSGKGRKPSVSGNHSMVCTSIWLEKRRCSTEKQTVSTLTIRCMKRMDLHTLSKDLKKLFDSKESCDTILYVKDKVFKAHRFVLMARSSVFAAIFLQDTPEKQTGIVSIPDSDPGSFEHFLEYLYTGQVDGVSFSSAFHLYYTSDKYGVQTLKTFCADYLKQCLTDANFCDNISFADMDDEEKLLSVAQDFLNHYREISCTAENEDLLGITNSSVMARNDSVLS